MTVGEAGVHAQHNGTTYYFCSEACQQAFLDNPTRYLGGGRVAMPGARPAMRAGTDRGHTLEATQPTRAGTRPVTNAILAFAILLGIYFGLLTLVSGREFALDQFSAYWYFIVSLAAGFAIQIGLYTRLTAMARHSAASGGVVAVSGTTSTAAMISCCAHYLTNILPIVGATGLVTLASQYQVEFFWVGLAFNAAGIGYIVPKVVKASKEHQQCASHS